MRFNFVTIGGFTEDLLFHSGEGLVLDNPGDLLRQKLLAFELGAKINIDQPDINYGGGAANVAINLAGLGFKTACLGSLGSDERALRILKNLNKNKVYTKKIDIIKKTESGVSFILNNKKDRIIFTYRGSNENLKIDKKHEALIRESAWVYLSSLPNKYLNTLRNIFSFKNKIAWNPGLKQLSEGEKILPFIKRTDIFMVNKDEALEMITKNKDFSDLSDRFLNNSKNLIFLLKKLGPEKIILTDGLLGAYFFDGDNFYHQKIIKAKRTVDNTGVGDAFNSTVVAFLEKFSGDYKRAMFLGAKNAASVVGEIGAQNGLLKIKQII